MEDKTIDGAGLGANIVDFAGNEQLQRCQTAVMENLCKTKDIFIGQLPENGNDIIHSHPLLLESIILILS